MLLCRTRPSPHKPGKTLGCNLFAPVRARGHRYMQKVAMPCPSHNLAGFSWFLLVSPEAVLLTKSLYVNF